MAAVEKRTISLPPEQAGYIDAQVANGTYVSASEVVRAGLRKAAHGGFLAGRRADHAADGQVPACAGHGA